MSVIEDAFQEVQDARTFEPEILLNKKSKLSQRLNLVSLRNLLTVYVEQRLKREGNYDPEQEITLTDTDALEHYEEAKPQKEGHSPFFKGLGVTKFRLLGNYLRKKGCLNEVENEK
jgi:hypothetical protein